jgi:hypothetical protein
MEEGMANPLIEGDGRQHPHVYDGDQRAYGDAQGALCCNCATVGTRGRMAQYEQCTLCHHPVCVRCRAGGGRCEGPVDPAVVG